MDNVKNFSGYIKLVALNLDSFESHVIYERNTASEKDIDDFKEKYENQDNIIPLIFHMECSGVHMAN